MLNVTVVNIRTLIKYLFFITLTSAFIFFMYSTFKLKKDNYESNNSSMQELLNKFGSYKTDKNSNDKQKNNTEKSKFNINILNQTISGISEINNQKSMFSEISYIESKNPLQFLLNSELPVLTSMVRTEDNSKDDNSYANADTNNANSVEHANTNVSTQVIDSGVTNTYTNEYNGVEIKNGTNYTLTDEMLNCNNLNINKSNIIIFHTHTCESYTQTENYSYEESGTFRTTDLNFSVSRVGDILTDQLLSYNYNVIHDKTYHDYPAYSGSYGRSMATVENLLISHPGTDIIIDLHRDAIADTSYAPSVKIGDEVVSQLMFVIGTDGGGLEHPNWQENLKFAISVQKKANELYPGLFRPILLRNSRYNQQLGKAACIIEVGATGNTLEQSMASMKYLALVLNELNKEKN